MINNDLIEVQNEINEFIKKEYYIFNRTYFNALVNKRDTLLEEVKKTKKNVTYLKPIFDGAKSFYKKCFYAENEVGIRLYSYDTLVMIYDKRNKTYKLNYSVGDLLFSQTTTRHLLEFLRQMNFDFKIDGKTRKALLVNNASGGLNA